MIEKSRFALNRIAAPALPLEAFFRLAAEAGLSKVELRGDLPGGRILDGLSPAQAAALARRYGIEVLSINALQKFNLRAVAAQAAEELERLLGLAAAVGCRALVLCPNNDPADSRLPAEREAETVEALRAFGPRFSERGLLGYVEPLGFAGSSLSSAAAAAAAIRASGFSCYRLLYDTFHQHLAADPAAPDPPAWPVSLVGLVHASGVEADLPEERWRDGHRLLPSGGDRSGCREQLGRLLRLGYAGDISLEPFSPEVQRLAPPELAAAVRASLDYLAG